MQINKAQLLLAASEADVQAASSANADLRELHKQTNATANGNVHSNGSGQQQAQQERPVSVIVPRKASSSELLKAAKVLLRCKDLLKQLKGKLEDKQKPVRDTQYNKFLFLA